MRPVSGLAILSLNPSLQMKLTDDYAAGNTDAHKSPVNERYGLITSVILMASHSGRSQFEVIRGLVQGMGMLFTRVRGDPNGKP